MLTSLNILYLFLGGTGAGMCVVLSCISLYALPRQARPQRAGRPFAPTPRYRRFLGMGYCVATVVLILAIACLLFDMRRPDAALTLIIKPVFNTVSIGAYSLGANIALGGFLASCWLSAFLPTSIIVGIASALSIVSALITASYTGQLLSLFATAPFWQTPLIIALFVVSSISCGIAAVSCSSIVFRSQNLFDNLLKKLLAFDRIAIVFELGLLAAFVAMAAFQYPEYGLRLVTGDLSWQFWLLLVFGGLGLPLVLSILQGRLIDLRIHPGVIALLVLMGGFMLRWCIVMAS